MSSKEKQLNSSQVIKYADWIKSNAEYMFNIIGNFLDVNIIDSGKIQLDFERHQILPLLTYIVTRYTQKAKCKEITLDFTHDNHEYIAYVDIKRVQQILENLISNAVKYSPFGKKVSIRISSTEKATICCEIQDEGPGLSHEDQAKLFNKFSRLSPQPTNNENSIGLGLFIVKKLVTAMGGKVWCESELGKGSKFIVEFMQKI